MGITDSDWAAVAKNIGVMVEKGQLKIVNDPTARDADQPAGNPHITFGEHEYTVTILSDGTTTEVQVYEPDADPTDSLPVALGVSRRRAGDTRNEKIGVALAAQRAFQSLADTYGEVARSALG